MIVITLMKDHSIHSKFQGVYLEDPVTTLHHGFHKGGECWFATGDRGIVYQIGSCDRQGDLIPIKGFEMVFKVVGLGCKE